MTRRDWLQGSAALVGTMLGCEAGDSHALADVPDSYSAPHALVSAADHELVEGYFVLGDATVIAKPGTDLYRWLAAHRDRAVVLSVREYRGVKE